MVLVMVHKEDQKSWAEDVDIVLCFCSTRLVDFDWFSD